LLAVGGACGREQAELRTDFPTDSTGAAVSTAGAPAPTVLLFGKSGPIDQGGYHPDFLEFRAELMRIAERRDTAALFRMIAPDFKASFGGDDGPQGLRDVYRVGAPDSEFWGLLTDVLIHGGRFDSEDRFTAPWTFGGLPESLDAFTHLIVRDEDVAVREAPDPESPAIALLAYDIVRAGPTSDAAWRSVALSDGGVGYVEAAHIRSPIDHRALFERRDGRWVMTAFVAGD
jgi:hypothetical protein